MNLLKTSYTFQVSPQSVDFRYKITLPALTDLLLTAAGYNADENGFGIRTLQQNNSSWVLLRLAIELHEFPEQYEELSIETWIHDIGRVNTSRNFRIRNNRQEIIGYAISNWAMIDMQTRRAIDLNSLPTIKACVSGDPVPIEKPAKLGPVEGEPFEQLKVRYSHIDINQHVNTMRYVEWISNYFDPVHYTSHQLKRFDINFMSELVFGDEVVVTGQSTEQHEYSFEIKGNNNTSCRARLLFQPIRPSL